MSGPSADTSPSCLTPSVFELPSPCAAIDADLSKWAFLDQDRQTTPLIGTEKSWGLMPSLQHTLADQTPPISLPDALPATENNSKTVLKGKGCDQAQRIANSSSAASTEATSPCLNQPLDATSKRKIAHSEVEKGRRQSISNGFAVSAAVTLDLIPTKNSHVSSRLFRPFFIPPINRQR